MAATTAGTKTVTHALAPHLSAATLTTLLATPLENLTIGQLDQICDALTRLPDGETPARTIGSLLI
jgi:hypothetical protein